MKRSYRLLGGTAGHEGLVALVGLHLAGRQFKGHGMGSWGAEKDTSAKGRAPYWGQVPVHKEYFHIQYINTYFVLPFSQPFGGKNNNAVTETA